MAKIREVIISQTCRAKLLKWNVQIGQKVHKDCVLATYIYCDRKGDENEFISRHKLKAKCSGTVVEMTAVENEEVQPGKHVLVIEEDHCAHETVMKEMCCDCGKDLRREPGIPGDLVEPLAASVSMVHNIPELRVSIEEAERLGRKDERQLLKSRKLALVVDLDQTLIHTTFEPVPADIKDLFHFNLPGHPFQYHTKLRPGAKRFLEAVSQYYELHIFTMGSRMYAHTIAKFLDPDEKLFAHRIRSRDECINAFSKSQDLRALFPCGDHMVCIIDDREDIWNFIPNLVTVKPYRYFADVGDINSPFQAQNFNTISEDQDFGSTADEKGKPSQDDVQNDTCEELDPDDQLSSAIRDSDCEEKGSISQKVEDNQKKNGTDINLGITGEITGLFREESFKGANIKLLNKSDTAEGCTEKPTETGIDILNKEMDAETEKGELFGKVEDKAKNAESPEEIDTSDLDDYLFYLEDILERIHMAFYSTLDAIKSKGGLAKSDESLARFCTAGTMNPDIRVIVHELKRQTLKGASIVFTGVVPINMQLEKSRAWRTAMALGATVTADIVKSAKRESSSNDSLPTTHVIAARGGTEKARRASKLPGVKLVNPNWLWCCNERWEWLDERLFPVPYPDKLSNDSTPVTSRQGTPVCAQQASVVITKPSDSKLAVDRDKANRQLTKIPYLPEKMFCAIDTFSANEIEEMDREVEELMQSDEEDDDSRYDEDSRNLFDEVSRSSLSSESPVDGNKSTVKLTVPCSISNMKGGKRIHSPSSPNSGSKSDYNSSTSDSNSSDESDSHKIGKSSRHLKKAVNERKRKRAGIEESELTVEGPSDPYFPTISSASDSSSSSDSEREDEGQMGAMLERQISGSPYIE